MGLEWTTHGIPNLERQLAKSTSLFVQAVALSYKRSDEGENPPEWRIENPEQRAAVALAAHRLLHKISKTPGINESGKIDAARLPRFVVYAVNTDEPKLVIIVLVN